MDPISLIVTALVLGATSALKDVAAQAVKDAYDGIKTIIKTRYSQTSNDLERLEKNPQSEGRQLAIQEDLEDQKAAKDIELVGKANDLLKQIQRTDPDTPRTFGLEISETEVDAQIKIKEIKVEGKATGVLITKSRINEGINIGIIDVKGNKDPN